MANPSIVLSVEGKLCLWTKIKSGGVILIGLI